MSTIEGLRLHIDAGDNDLKLIGQLIDLARGLSSDRPMFRVTLSNGYQGKLHKFAKTGVYITDVGYVKENTWQIAGYVPLEEINRHKSDWLRLMIKPRYNSDPAPWFEGTYDTQLREGLLTFT